MEDLKKYLPLVALLLAALIVTGLAIMQFPNNPSLGTKESFDIYLWATPIGYLGLLMLFKRHGLNRWNIALVGVAVYFLSAVLLFVPVLPPGLQWHYPIGLAALVFLFFG